ncbi:MAG TPA: phosphatidylglycerophosphatase A [Pyrinomonadaceae bacterium]|nr:phosphatidylglycerophosphatase A [Pyrinomonadaceae bacterium]
MSIKESSDEFNPPVVSADAVLKSKTQRSLKDYLALAIATCGVGYLPLAPGTWGSLLAVVFYWFLHGEWFPHTDLPPGAFLISFLVVQLALVTAVIVIGTWAASRTERVLQIKDPGRVVIDEVAGQLIALMAVPGGLWRMADAMMLWAAFLLFRLFDIVKPYPARKLEGMRGGVGIIADDIVAGLYAFLGVMVIRVLIN